MAVVSAGFSVKNCSGVMLICVYSCVEDKHPACQRSSSPTCALACPGLTEPESMTQPGAWQDPTTLVCRYWQPDIPGPIRMLHFGGRTNKQVGRSVRSMTYYRPMTYAAHRNTGLAADGEERPVGADGRRTAHELAVLPAGTLHREFVA